MSMEAVKEFRALVNADVSLQEAVRATALDPARVVDLGKAHGFDFTAGELEAFVAETELTDMELEFVGGGGGLICGDGGGAKG